MGQSESSCIQGDLRGSRDDPPRVGAVREAVLVWSQLLLWTAPLVDCVPGSSSVVGIEAVLESSSVEYRFEEAAS
jgi:hypothetical protein